jgi:uncharacterized protein DUF6644
MYDASNNFLNVHEWAYGATEAVHILSLAAAIGFIALVDLRLLGFSIGQATPARLTRATAVGGLIGLVVAITTGFMVFSTDPIRYFNHPTMRFKLIALVVAILFNYTIHSRVARGDYSPSVRRTVASVSLVLWVTIVFSGIFYAFT